MDPFLEDFLFTCNVLPLVSGTNIHRSKAETNDTVPKMAKRLMTPPWSTMKGTACRAEKVERPLMKFKRPMPMLLRFDGSSSLGMMKQTFGR